MGIQISRINRGRSSLGPSPPPPARTISDPTPSSSSSARERSSSNPDLSSYEAACRADPHLRSFDSSVQLRTSRAINSIAVGLDARALSLDSLSQVTECLLEMNQEVVRIILQNKRDVWKNPELSDLVDDYFDNSLLTLDFCTALDACLKRAGHIESIINVALRKFQEEHYGAAEEGVERNYAKTLEELSNFKAAGDPFTEEFFRVFNSIYSRQILMFERLQAKKRKLDKKLKRLKGWRRVSNVIFIAAFASVLICSVVAAAVSAPPVVTALAAAAAVPLGSMGRWLNSMWKNYGRDLMGQRELISSMEIGSYIVLNDLDSIKRLVDRFQIVIEALVAKAEFAMRGEEAVVVAVEEIRQQVDSFIKTIQELRDRTNKCTQETRMARTLILRKIMNHPTSSNQDIVIVRAFTSQKFTHHRKPTKRFPQKLMKSPIKKHNVVPEYAMQRISKIYNILKYSTWDSAQEQLEKLSVKWDSYTVNQVLKTHPPMEKAWLFFNWASARKSFRHDQYTYTTMLDIFGEAKRISSMMYVFNQMKEKCIKVDVVTYTSLMHWMSNDGDVDGAIDLWKEMRAKGCRPTIVSYTAYIKILLDSKRVNVASGVYKEMLDSGLSPNCHTYTVLMEYLASSGKFSEALEIFNKMQDAGVQPDKAACNILIEICCRTGEIWLMVKILEYMKENFLVLRNPVYQKALETFKIAEESDELLRQVNRHFSAEYSNENINEDDALLYNSEFDLENGLVSNFMNKQNLFAVDSLLADMADKGVQLDSKVISNIIEVNIARQRQNGAVLAFDYSVKSGISIERRAYLALIGFSIRVNSFHKVVEIVEKMVKQGLSLGTQLNSLLIYRLGCGGEASFAEKVFDLLPDKDKSCVEYTAIIGAYFFCGNPSKGLETFKIMKTKGVTVTLGTYRVMVAGLEKCGKAREVEYYSKEKKGLQMERCSTDISMEETICNLLFAGNHLARRVS